MVIKVRLDENTICRECGKSLQKGSEAYGTIESGSVFCTSKHAREFEVHRFPGEDNENPWYKVR